MQLDTLAGAVRARLLIAPLVLMAALFTHAALAATVEQETVQRLNKIRALPPDVSPERMRQHNEEMDEVWQYYHQHRNQSLPVLRKELAKELKSKSPSQLLLLDVASFLYLDGETDDRKQALQALLAIDPSTGTIQSNFDQLFRLTQGLAVSADPRLLPFIDKTFLPTERGVFLSEQSFTLNPTLMCAFLYGVYGPEGERHLQPFLANPDLLERVLEVLKWIGSPASVDAVKSAVPKPVEYGMFSRELTFMMVNGGPQGREAMLGIDPAQLDAQAKEQYQKVKPAIEAQNYAQLRPKFDQFTGEKNVDPEQIKRQLQAMIDNYGKDTRLNPQALLDSSLPKDYLIEQLTRIRARMFTQLVNQTLSDVELTNAVLNTLRYRDH